MFGNKLLVVRGYHDAGSALSIGGSIVSGMLSDDSSGDAASAAKKANALNQKMIKDQQAQNNLAYSPYAATGNAANSRLSDLLGIGNNTVTKAELVQQALNNPEFNQKLLEQGLDPNKWADAAYEKYINGYYGGRQGLQDYYAKEGADFNDKNSGADSGSLLKTFGADDLAKDVVYNTGLQFGLDEGEKAINRRAAASGGWDSGATLKSLARYANDYGSQKAGEAYNRFNQDKLNTYNFLSGQQGVGFNATNANQSLNTSLLTGAMNSNTGSANAVGLYGIQGANGLNNAIQGGIGNYLYNQRVNSPVVSYGSGYGSSGVSGGVPWYLS